MANELARSYGVPVWEEMELKPSAGKTEVDIDMVVKRCVELGGKDG